MREIIVTENVSLDGVMAPMEGWFDPSDSGPDLLAASTAHREAADALVLGRITYEEFANFWPHQTDDRTGVTDYLNRVAKYPVSATMDEPDWAGTTVLRGLDDVAALREQPGRDIVVTGSATLVRALQGAGLVDRYRIFTYPAVQGHGRRLFPDGLSARLRLEDVQHFAGGVVLTEYRTTSGTPAGSG